MHRRLGRRPGPCDALAEARRRRERLGVVEMAGHPVGHREREFDERPRQHGPQPGAPLVEQSGQRLEQSNDGVDPLRYGGVVPREIGGQGDRPDVSHRVTVEIHRFAKPEHMLLE